MADGWDLHAVVSGFTSTASSANVTVNGQITNVEAPLRDLASFNNDDTPLNSPVFGDNSNFEFQGLEEIYYRSYNLLKPQPNNPSTSSISLTQHQTQLLPAPQRLLTPQLKKSRPDSSVTLPSARSRRKNQQTKLVRQMTHEELLADWWAWRKYGQKPIKGSPYPRNYYRCSTSKSCAARKQVEKSPSDPDIYVVSFSGEHAHPRPTHRNSLSGTTRNKFSRPNGGNLSQPRFAEPAEPTHPCSSSSPVSASNFSPSTPLTEGESAPPENSGTETIDIVNGGDEMGKTEFDDDIMISNKVVSEDIFRVFQDLGSASDSTRF